jgi:hypothetical protein
MGEIEKIQAYIKEIKSAGSKKLTNGVRLTKKDLPNLQKLVADVKLGGDIWSDYSNKVDTSKLISEGADDAFDTAVVNKILESSGNHGLGKFKDSNLENIGRTENIGGVASKQIFVQSAGVQEYRDDIDIAERISKAPPNIADYDDNALRLTSQYKVASSKGLSDAAALRVTKATIRKRERIGSNILETLPSANRSLQKAQEKARESKEALEYLEKESGLYGDKYYGPADAHVKEYNLTAIANESSIGKKVPFTSGAEVKEYNKMVQEYDKIEYSPSEKNLYFLQKDIDKTQLENLESSKVGSFDAINVSDATQANPMVVENFGDMKIGGGFRPKYMEDLDVNVRLEYEKAYGDKTVPINSLDPVSNKSIRELSGKVGDTFTYGISKEGKEQYFKVGPPIEEAAEKQMGIKSFGADMSEQRYDEDIYSERASKTKPGTIEQYAKSKRDAKPTAVPRRDLSTDRPTSIMPREYNTQNSLLSQMNELKAMYPNVANKNNLVRLAVRNMEKSIGLPANKKLLYNLSKFL